MLRLGRVLAALTVLGLWLGSVSTTAAPIATQPFTTTWSHTDQPVVDHTVNRTWMWGPEADSVALWENYAQSPGGVRQVQYFDKTRMEINDPNGDPSSIWYVTNGLLAKELITGQMQLGDATFVARSPAQVNVAGDTNDPNGPTYATFSTLMGYGANPDGWTIVQTVDRAGTVGSDSSLASYSVSAMDVSAPTNHTVASVFWDFMNSSGPVEQNGQLVTDQLFQNPFYATGYPLTEAYWTHVLVGGVSKLVLVQVFERRVLTYTPDNSAGWQVEAGNVGLQYYLWRYGQTPAAFSTCRGGDPLANVYHVDRLQLQNSCITVTGMVDRITNEDDGDVHVNVKLDPAFSNLLNDKNVSGENGDLVTEIVPADEPGCTPGQPPKPAHDTYDYGYCTGANVQTPALGNQVQVTGPYVLDQDHGWMEIHPVWSMIVLGSTSPSPSPEPSPNPGAGVQATASVSNATPAKYSTVTVYGTLTNNGQGVSGVTMTATWHYKTTTSSCTGTTGSNGTASCSRGIANATSGYTVVIDVSFDWNGQTYTAETSFTPQ